MIITFSVINTIMKKSNLSFIIAIVVLVVIGALVLRERDQHCLDDNKDNIEGTYGFHIETLSDKNIYCPGTAVSVCYPSPRTEKHGELISIANSYAILNAAYCDAELWFRFGMVVNDTIRQAHIDYAVWDWDARKAVKKYVNTIVDVLPRDTALWIQSDSALWNKVWTAYRTCAVELSELYSLKRYGNITEEDVRKYMDVRQFIPNYDSIYDLRRKKTMVNEMFLLSLAEQATDFDRQCLYTIEYAHQSRSRIHNKAISLLASLMESRKYSRYLNEVWRTWRCLRQLEESSSRDSMIPNLEYNKMRYRCLETINRRIMDNLNDIYAMNDYCFLATYGNITRYSEYMYGNSVGLEQMMLFPELFEESQ